jgi:hypothetical protein
MLADKIFPEFVSKFQNPEFGFQNFITKSGKFFPESGRLYACYKKSDESGTKFDHNSGLIVSFRINKIAWK